MLSSVEVFDLIKLKHQIPSDYALAKRLGVTNGLIAHHRSKPFGMSPELALKCAELLRYDPGLLLMWSAVARAKCPAERDALARVAGVYELQKLDLNQKVAVKQ